MRRDHACMPLAGGTDVMVELNFDRHRPEAILDLTRVAELARVGAHRRRAAHRRGHDLRAADARPRGVVSQPRACSAHGRLAADPEPGHDRRQPRGRLACGRLPPRAARRRCRDRAALRRRGDAPRARRGVLHRPQAQRASGRRADHRRPRADGAGAAAVRQGRDPQRDGDRRLLVRDRARPGLATRRHRDRLGRADAVAGARGRALPRGRARRGRRAGKTAAVCPTPPSRASASSPRPRRRRSTTCAEARPTAATRSTCWRSGRCAGRSPGWSGRVLLSRL